MIMGYKSRTTVYKWLAEDPEFKEDVICMEMSIYGLLESVEMQAVSGGRMLRDELEVGYYPNGAMQRKRTVKRWAPINARVLISAMERRSARLNRILKAKTREEELEALMEL
jgi:hypothetical protein